jgi:hypothetical protein
MPSMGKLTATSMDAALEADEASGQAATSPKGVRYYLCSPRRWVGGQSLRDVSRLHRPPDHWERLIA